MPEDPTSASAIALKTFADQILWAPILITGARCSCHVQKIRLPSICHLHKKLAAESVLSVGCPHPLLHMTRYSSTYFSVGKQRNNLVRKLMQKPRIKVHHNRGPSCTYRSHNSFKTLEFCHRTSSELELLTAIMLQMEVYDHGI
eukprot:1912123-Pyramimonas_sp.AAC.2